MLCISLFSVSPHAADTAWYKQCYNIHLPFILSPFHRQSPFTPPLPSTDSRPVCTDALQECKDAQGGCTDAAQKRTTQSPSA